jgi:hypothetical protein
VNLRLNCALEVRIEEGRRGRWGEMAGGGAGCDAGEGSRRLGVILTGGAGLAASGRERRGSWAALASWAGRGGGPVGFWTKLGQRR